MIIQREKQKATALNIVSFLSVSFSFYLPLLSPPPPRHPPPLSLLHTHTPSIYVLIRGWQCELREESTQDDAHSRGAALAHLKGERGGGWGSRGLSAWTFLVRKAQQ